MSSGPHKLLACVAVLNFLHRRFDSHTRSMAILCSWNTAQKLTQHKLSTYILSKGRLHALIRKAQGTRTKASMMCRGKSARGARCKPAERYTILCYAGTGMHTTANELAARVLKTFAEATRPL